MAEKIDGNYKFTSSFDLFSIKGLLSGTLIYFNKDTARELIKFLQEEIGEEKAPEKPLMTNRDQWGWAAVAWDANKDLTGKVLNRWMSSTSLDEVIEYQKRDYFGQQSIYKLAAYIGPEVKADPEDRIFR